MDYRKLALKLDSMDDKEYIENFLLYNLAPVISGVKPASTLTLKKGENQLYDKWIKYGEVFVKEIGLDYIVLRETNSTDIILLYREDKLNEHLLNENNREFLLRLGYEDDNNINTWLKTLKNRYEQYHCPHELGIFLGIPVNDVEDFMNCTSKKCILCRYWKVYNDEAEAKKIFDRYDNIRKHAINKIIDNKDVISIANSLKTIVL